MPRPILPGLLMLEGGGVNVDFKSKIHFFFVSLLYIIKGYIILPIWVLVLGGGGLL